VLNEYRGSAPVESGGRDHQAPGGGLPARHRQATRSTRYVPNTSPAPPLRRPIAVTDDLLPERGAALQALTHDVLVARSLQISSSGFITIISIIQGVALALLAQNTFDSPSRLGYFQSFTMLLVLVNVFYFYLSISVLLRWAPSFMDAFLPFGVAGLEIPPAFFLGNAAAWNAWLGAFWIFTAGGLYITIKWSPLSHFGDDRAAHRLLHQWLGELRLVTGIGGVLLLILGFLAAQFAGHQAWCGAAGVAVALVIIGVVVTCTEFRLAQIHHHFGVNRPPFN
jgi:hypothetical protein